MRQPAQDMGHVTASRGDGAKAHQQAAREGLTDHAPARPAKFELAGNQSGNKGSYDNADDQPGVPAHLGLRNRHAKFDNGQPAGGDCKRITASRQCGRVEGQHVDQSDHNACYKPAPAILEDALAEGVIALWFIILILTGHNKPDYQYNHGKSQCHNRMRKAEDIRQGWIRFANHNLGVGLQGILDGFQEAYRGQGRARRQADQRRQRAKHPLADAVGNAAGASASQYHANTKDKSAYQVRAPEERGRADFNHPAHCHEGKTDHAHQDRSPHRFQQGGVL